MPGLSALVMTTAVLVSSAVVCPNPPAEREPPREAPLVAACVARPPSPGEVFAGAVLQVIDGRTICVAQGPTPADWIRVTIAGAPQDGSRGALMAASFGRSVACVAVRATEAGVQARCVVDGLALDAVMGTEAVRLEGLSWR
jgi:hypothetical protein